MMTLETFRAHLPDPAPPAGLGPALIALWWAGKGEWDRAHEVVQQREGDPDCDWVHAHLHRQEGDPSNARYWYPPCRTAGGGGGVGAGMECDSGRVAGEPRVAPCGKGERPPNTIQVDGRSKT